MWGTHYSQQSYYISPILAYHLLPNSLPGSALKCGSERSRDEREEARRKSLRTVNFCNGGCKTKVSGSRRADLQQYSPPHATSAVPASGSNKGHDLQLSSMNTQTYFLPSLLPSLSSTPSSPSLGKGSIISWHGSLGKQGKD